MVDLLMVINPQAVKAISSESTCSKNLSTSKEYDKGGTQNKTDFSCLARLWISANENDAKNARNMKNPNDHVKYTFWNVFLAGLEKKKN